MSETKAKISESPFNKEYWQLKFIKLKDTFPQLKSMDLTYDEGKFDETIDKLHTKIGETIGKTKSELHQLIEKF